MTIQIDRSITASRSNPAYGFTAPRAAVWDIPATEEARPCLNNVRTISCGSRTPERYRKYPTCSPLKRNEAFETRHENRASLVMGAALGLALVLGSTVGGAFSAGSDTGLERGVGASGSAVVSHAR